MPDLSTTLLEFADLEWRNEGGDGRTMIGLVVPWNTPTMIPSERIWEQFRTGAFDDTIARRGDRIPLRREHDRQSWPIGRSTGFRNDARGLVGTFRFATTPDAELGRTLVEDGTIYGLSVGFQPLKSRTVGDRDGVPIVERQRAYLDHVGLVHTAPAYEDARVLALRDASCYPEEHATPPGTPRLDRWRHWAATI